MSFLASTVAIPPAHSNEQAECTVASIFGHAAEATIEACTAILQRKDIDTGTRVESLKIRGRAERSRGHLEDSAKNFAAALLLAPEDPELHTRLGEVQFFQNDFENAKSHAVRAIGFDPSYARAYALFGDVARRTGSPKTALAAFDRAVEFEPTEPRYHFSRFSLLMAMWNDAEAMQEAEIILNMPREKIAEPRTIAYVNVSTNYQTGVRIDRAKVLRRMGRIQDAEASLDDAVRDDPCGLTYAWRGDFRIWRDFNSEMGRDDVNKALALTPEYWLPHQSIGLVHLNSKSYEAAAAEFAKAAQLNPTAGDPLWWRAMSLRMLSRFDEATETALKAMEVDNDVARSKINVLVKQGYLPHAAPENATQQSIADYVRDAVTACMMDENCG